MSKYHDRFYEFFKQHSDKDWCYSRLSNNPNITFQDVLDNTDKNWVYFYLSGNSNITLQNILDHPEIPWNYTSLSANIMLNDHHLNKKQNSC